MVPGTDGDNIGAGVFDNDPLCDLHPYCSYTLIGVIQGNSLDDVFVTYIFDITKGDRLTGEEGDTF